MDWFLNSEINNKIKSNINDFENGTALAFKVPVRIKGIDSSPSISYFKVFIQRDEALRESDAHFVRNGITITGEGKRVKSKLVRAIIIIEDLALVKLLGLAENPAHTEWQKNSSHFRGKYEDGDKVINFLQLAADKIFSLLIRPAEGIDRDIMKDIFYMSNIEESDDLDDETNDKENVKPIIERGEYRAPYVLERRVGGFRLRNNPEINGFSGSIKVSVAYMVLKGSPLRSYSKYDFDLASSPIEIRSSGVRELEYGGNRITFKVDPANEYSVDVDGFDVHRDIIIKVNHHDSEI